MSRLILASASPRRRELLEQIGVCYQVAVARVDETPTPGEDPASHVLRLARTKAEAVCRASATELPILGVDTVVALDGQILGKPRDREHALAMLRRLSGRSHKVFSGACLLLADGRTLQAVSCSRVHFRPLTEDEIISYWEAGESWDKAGAYAIQGRGAIFVRYLEGSFSGVMGLPLYEIAELLHQAGIEVL